MQKIAITFCRRFAIEIDANADYTEQVKSIAKQIKQYINSITDHQIIKMASNQALKLQADEQIEKIEL